MHPIQIQASAGKREETGKYRGDPREYPEGTPRMGLSRDRDSLYPQERLDGRGSHSALMG